jgi:serine O-acetyltransferase
MPKEKSFIIDFNAIIGKGFVAFHPYSTILNVKSIGKNCVVRHLSTFGNKEDDNSKIPVIKDNVVFGANVMVVGEIVINDNSVIGAGTVVTKTIPENCVVVGNPGRIIKRDGIRI